MARLGYLWVILWELTGIPNLHCSQLLKLAESTYPPRRAFMVKVGTTHAAVDKSFRVTYFDQIKVTPEITDCLNINNLIFII